MTIMWRENGTSVSEWHLRETWDIWWPMRIPIQGCKIRWQPAQPNAMHNSESTHPHGSHLFHIRWWSVNTFHGLTAFNNKTFMLVFYCTHTIWVFSFQLNSSVYFAFKLFKSNLRVISTKCCGPILSVRSVIPTHITQMDFKCNCFVFFVN